MRGESLKPLHIDPRTVDLDAMIDQGIRLHGHEGPFLVAGIRMGLLALDLLQNPGYFGIKAESQAGTTPPLSCLSDGIQIGSGCTVGKGNLRVTDVGRPAVRFADARGHELVVELRADVLQTLLESSVEEACALARQAPVSKLFLWEWGAIH
jgi:formylmethanofuran dehydrogenase subunit E